jgi:hypothetical protein
VSNNPPPSLALTVGGPTVAASPFLLADGSGPPRQRTRATARATAQALTISFTCDDTDAWGTLKGRDAPVYKEECVEVFLAPGAADAKDYFEFELSPLGTFFDARIHNPTGRRESLSADLEWSARGASWKAAVDKAGGQWTAELRLPWAGLGFPDGVARPAIWRLNLYRIDRPRDGSPPEYSCWSPTLATPPNFHLPARFGTLRLL